MRDYNQPLDSQDDNHGHDNQDTGGQTPETKALSPEQAHRQARENYQQAKSSLLETREGRRWLSNLRWSSTETIGHHAVGSNRDYGSEETHLVGEAFFNAKGVLAESFSDLPAEDKAKMRPNVQIEPDRRPENSFDHLGLDVIDTEKLAEIADAHHSLVHFRYQIGQARRASAPTESGDIKLDPAGYEAIGQAWVAEQYLGEATRLVESYVEGFGNPTSGGDRQARMDLTALKLHRAHEQATDVGDQDVELGLHELKNKLIADDDKWDRLLNWEA